MPRRARSRGGDIEFPSKKRRNVDTSSASESEADSDKENGVKVGSFCAFS